jgi:hypothetical protein
MSDLEAILEIIKTKHLKTRIISEMLAATWATLQLLIS